MADPFLSEIRIMSFNYPPRGWALCNGQLLPIAQNQALFSLLVTTYGGNGQSTFALPNLQGRAPIHVGNGHALGERGGEAAHALSVSEMPQHAHTLNGTTSTGTKLIPTANLLAKANLPAYHAPSNLVAMVPETVAPVGGSQAHTNLMPYLTLSFCIALQGIFPSHS